MRVDARAVGPWSTGSQESDDVTERRGAAREGDATHCRLCRRFGSWETDVTRAYVGR